MMLKRRGVVFYSPGGFAHIGEVEIMAQDKPITVDDVARRLRDLMRDLENVINPQKPKRVPVPVRVPVRPAQPTRRDPYPYR
jgi:hypothetical protein